jgi:hypothetical protein
MRRCSFESVSEISLQPCKDTSRMWCIQITSVLNMELDILSLFGHPCTAVLIGCDPATPPLPPPPFRPFQLSQYRTFSPFSFL